MKSELLRASLFLTLSSSRLAFHVPLLCFSFSSLFLVFGIAIRFFFALPHFFLFCFVYSVHRR
jgi:hypothetical protein